MVADNKMLVLLILLARLLAVASASKHHMAIESRSPELSATMDENFASMLNMLSNRSNCCNALISGESTMSQNLLRKFFSVYPYAYTLNKTSSLCNGYVIISTASVDKLQAEMRRVPTTTLATELLIFFDRNVEESSGLFNVSMYDQANVNIGAPNGLWTLQKDFLLSPVFKKVFSHREILPNQRVNLQGQQLIATTLYMPPMCYLQTSENRTVKGINREYFIAKNESEVDGIELKLFMLFAEHLNFTWAITRPNEDDDFGDWNGTSWDGGMIGQVLRENVDVAFGQIWLLENAFIAANLTKAWGFVAYKFLVPRPKPYFSFWGLTRTLSPAVWVAVLAALITQSVYVWVHAWLASKPSKRFRNLAVTLTASMGSLIGSWYPSKIQGLSIQHKLWNFLGIILVTAYSSSLAATLTSYRYEKRIDTFQDFIEANLTWGVSWLLPIELLVDPSDTYAKQLPERFISEHETTDRHEKILQGNYAIFGTALEGIFFPDESFEKEDFKGYRLMKESFRDFRLSFVVQPWLLGPINKILQRLQEAGLVQYQIDDVLHRRTGDALREVLVEYDHSTHGPSVLRLFSIGAGFVILVIGAVISTVVFILELRSANKERSIRQSLVEMQKRRANWHANELRRKRVDRMFRKLRQRTLGYTFPQFPQSTIGTIAMTREMNLFSESSE